MADYALRYSRHARFVQPALVDGTPGLAIVMLGRVIGALGFTFRGAAIVEIETIDAPPGSVAMSLSYAGANPAAAEPSLAALPKAELRLPASCGQELAARLRAHRAA